MEPRRIRIHSAQGPLDVYPQLRLVRRGDAQESVRPKTFDVLVFLLRNRQRVVSKEELLREVWPQVSVTDDVLVRSVLEIRRLIGDDPKSPVYIRTVARTGYQFVGPVELEQPDTQEEARRPAIRWPFIAAAAAFMIIAGLLLWRLSIRSPASNPSGRSWEVAWWRFDEKGGDFAEDSSGFGNRGKLMKGAVRSTGKLGGAVHLDGLNAFVEGLNPGRLPAGNAPRSVMAWIRTNTTSGTDVPVFLYGSAKAGSGPYFMLGLDASARTWTAWANLGISGARRLDDGEWHHVSASYSGSTNQVRLFVDGEEDHLLKHLNSNPPTTQLESPWRIGRPFSGTAFRGEIDDVRVFDRALESGEFQAYYRCSAALPDISVAGAPYYFMPVFQGRIKLEPASGTMSSSIAAVAEDFAGIQFARSDGVCAGPLRGANVGQDITIEADYRLPSLDHALTVAGPYFRSRTAAAADGLIGGTSAGYWVQLTARGRIKIFCLNPQKVIAFTRELPDFEPSRFHHMLAAARGTELQVQLDGKPVEFDQAGTQVKVVRIPPLWEEEKAGINEGAAGIAFTADPRAMLSGQEVRNIRVSTASIK